jgi:hypothetical protein
MTDQHALDELDDDAYEALVSSVVEAQQRWITERCGAEAARRANYGWGIDDVDSIIQTKVYGHGVLTSTIEPEPKHDFEEFKS